MKNNHNKFFQLYSEHLKYLLFILILFYSCSRNRTGRPSEEISSKNTYNIGAERFSIVSKPGSTLLTIKNPWQGAQNINQEYYLVPRGTKIPDGVDSSMVIFVPIRSVICMSTTHLAMISALGEGNSISGMSGTEYIYNKSLLENVKNGLIADIGYESNLNKELILKINPDLIVMYGIGSESAGYVGKIKELGVNVLFNADYLETDPLKKAEWIKVFGALYCKERLADSIFSSEVESYKKLELYIDQSIKERPKVLLGLPFRDTWYISPGNSFISKLIKDAGGEYLWQNRQSSISMPFGIENVYLQALAADYWLNIGSISSSDEIKMIDKRLADLPCFAAGKLYNNNLRITEEGGNDYWENGSLYPHLILRDIAIILHPEIFEDSILYFYRKIY